MPHEGDRRSYVLTFDWGEGDTRGMLDALRTAGIFAVTGSRLPRTTIVCRTKTSVSREDLRALISEQLQDNGSAVITEIGGQAFYWPDHLKKDEEGKRWIRISA